MHAPQAGLHSLVVDLIQIVVHNFVPEILVQFVESDADLILVRLLLCWGPLRRY